ncbi:alpha/beta fold hydrolase [Auraticoccus monumenti]|uniref:Pimeloyl-ACP methyl ester carboxylesterase n=1 Tax=Auraticoccus monumenti TaxID=675864 RepID=A0A1G6YUG7_9ACTN|nr:alpha/beta hydrolase [Auraticoccus monumenti]SDD93287.1 Pimeloyl-ACP methyl ester carboxylesterase [Auraticoccus monumenti]
MEITRERAERVPTRLGSLSVRRLGSGVPTVLWSSMFVDSHTWDRMLPLLLGGAPGREYLLVDPPGLGRSDPLERRSSIAEAAGAARDVLDTLGVTEPADWVGNAFGGHVGYQLATDPAAVRSLVAVSAPTEPVPPALRRQIAVLHPLLRVAGPVGPVRRAVVSAMLTDASAGDEDVRGVVLDSLDRPTRVSLSRALRSYIIDRADVTDRLPRIHVPCLFVASDDRGDWSPEDARRAASLAPAATALTISGARTLIPLEQPAALADAVLAFWSTLR